MHTDQGPYTDAASADSWLRDLEKIVKNTKENWKIQKVCWFIMENSDERELFLSDSDDNDEETDKHAMAETSDKSGPETLEQTMKTLDESDQKTSRQAKKKKSHVCKRRTVIRTSHKKDLSRNLWTKSQKSRLTDVFIDEHGF